MSRVLAVHLSAEHAFSKQPQADIELVEGLGVRGDAHAGATVQHRSRVARDPSQPNLRQVHLIHAELLTALAVAGFEVARGSSARTSPPRVSTCWRCPSAPGCASVRTRWSH